MEGLFEGLQIMTPQELETSFDSGSNEDVNKQGDEPIVEDNVDFNITPVVETTEDVKDTTDDGEPKVVKTTTDTPQASGNEKIYKALLKELINEGILSVEQQEELDELPGSLESIKSVLEQTVSKKFEKKQEAWKESLSPEKKRFLGLEDAFDTEVMAINMAQRLEFFDSITTEELSGNVDLQKQIYFEALKQKGFSDEEATEEVADADALGKLDDKAGKALPQLRKQANDYVEAARTEKIQKTENLKQQRVQQFESLVKTIDEKESIIEGINLNKIAKDKLKENMTKFVHTDEKGKQYTSLMHKQKTNPAGFEIMINYLDTLGVFNMDKNGNFKPDISKLKAVAKTKAVNELDKVIAAENEKGFGRNTSLDDSETSKNLIDFLSKATGFKGKK